MQRFEAIVIGAGNPGASTAFHVREHGVHTALIERTPSAGGPSDVSGALTHSSYLMPELVAP